MTRLPAFLILLSAALISNGQNINITFSGTEAAIQIDSVKAVNLATDESVMLPGNETLVLTPKTGVAHLQDNSASGIIFPNPFSGRASLIASVQKPQTVLVKAQNLAGQVVAQTQASIQPGENEFILAVSGEGIYLVSLTTCQGTIGFKVICSGSSGSANNIKYAGATSIPDAGRLKSLSSVYALGYSAGDSIQYTCKSGNYTAIFSDSPMESKNYEVAFTPIASFVIEPAEGNTETKFKLDATASHDAETPAEELEFRWDLDGDGNWDTEFFTDPFCGYKFNWAGSYSVVLEVRDAGGLTAQATVTVGVVNASEGTFIDPRDNNKYPYKTIGAQVWMTKNLAWLPEVHPSSAASYNEPLYYVSGYEGTSVTDAKATSLYPVYGALYNFPAAKIACPAGWHTPGDQEWSALEMFLGMPEAHALLFSTDRGIAQGVGDQLRETGMTHWGGSVNLTSTNTTGFSAIGGGARDYDPIGFLAAPAQGGYFFTSTEANANQAIIRILHVSNRGVPRWDDLKEAGMSVRCIRDPD